MMITPHPVRPERSLNIVEGVVEDTMLNVKFFMQLFLHQKSVYYQTVFDEEAFHELHELISS